MSVMCTVKCSPLIPAVNSSMVQHAANTKIPRIKNNTQEKILAYVATPRSPNSLPKFPVLVLIHEFFGLSPEICEKAEAIAQEVGCIVICPDTYRGQSTRFIPKAIFLALTTRQERVNEDLDEVLGWAETYPQADSTRVGLAGFCYGGGKALRYGIHYKNAKAIVVIYGKPVLETNLLRSITGEVLGIYGDKDSQFPIKQINQFSKALEAAGVPSKIVVINDQGHAFWRNMTQVKNGEKASTEAWLELTGFLKRALKS